MATLAYNVDINGNPIPSNLPDGAEILQQTEDFVEYKIGGKVSTAKNTGWGAAFRAAQQFFDAGKRMVSKEEKNLALALHGAKGSDAEEALAKYKASGDGLSFSKMYDTESLKKKMGSTLPVDFLVQNVKKYGSILPPGAKGEVGFSTGSSKNFRYNDPETGERLVFRFSNDLFDHYFESDGTPKKGKSYGALENYAKSQLKSANIDLTEFATGTTPSTSKTSSSGSSSTSSSTNIPNAPKIQNLLEELKNTAEFKALPSDQQELVSQVYSVIAENDIDNAERLSSAFKTAAKISDPFFKQQILIAKDAIERGFVSIDQDQQYQEKQLSTRLKDLREDVENRKEYIGLEEQSALRGLERQYQQQQKQVRQNMAASGFTSSSRREETEGLLNETTGDLRESTKRSFGMQMRDTNKSLERGERDVQSEIERLTELTKGKKLELFRQAEQTLGSKNLPSLNTNLDPLGGIVGDIPQAQTRDIIQGAQSLIF